MFFINMTDVYSVYIFRGRPQINQTKVNLAILSLYGTASDTITTDIDHHNGSRDSDNSYEGAKVSVTITVTS